MIAIYFFFLNLAGIGLGPAVVALITNQVFGNDLAIRYSLAIVAAIMAPMSVLLRWKGR